ncbi:MAG: adenosylcobinamide-GDP ribazoletransferase [Anaerolineae bacterium]|nr:adenosylcobinamide-GDP ribazoletransferase [Anaerolineae bacterium]
MMIGLLAAFQFLSILPPVIKRLFTPEEMGHAVGYFPLVGLVLGGILAAARLLLDLVLPTAVSAVIVVTLWVVLTRALHLDGLMDTCDGVFGGYTVERRLDIMRDSRVGAFGVVGGVLALLAKAAAVASLGGQTVAPIMAAVLGRWAMSLAVVAFPYARADGLGRAMKDHAGWKQLLMAGVIAGLVAWFGGCWVGMIFAGGAIVVCLALGRFFVKRIGGLTGDTYGAICEVIEVCVLVGYTALNG